MANGISGVFGEKASAANGLNKQTGRGTTIKDLLFSPPLTVGEADTALGHITGQFVDRQNSANQTAAVKNSTDGDANPEREVKDFLSEILEQQPIRVNDANQTKTQISMRLPKPAEQMTRADYNDAFRRAIYDKATAGVKLSDEEIKLADKALVDAGLYKTEYNLLGRLEDLQRLQTHFGNPMPVKVGRENLEYAARAAQAVLQYKQQQAIKLDAAVERGKSYVNGAIGGFVEKPYNAVVNNINGLSEPFRAGERVMFGTSYIPEFPRSTIGDKSEYWQQKRYNGVSLNMMGEGASTIGVGIIIGKPLYNTRLGALLGVQVGAYNIGVGASGIDPLHPDKPMSDLERETRIVGGTMGVVSAPFSPDGRALSNDALALPNTARNTVRSLDEIFRPPQNPPLAPAGNVPNGFAAEILTGRTPLETINEPLEISISSEKANQPHVKKGDFPPYGGTRAQEIILREDTIFVRVHSTIKRQGGRWLMRQKDIEGLTPQQIKDKFALPELPIYVSDVYVPAGAKLTVGKVAFQEGWGKGSGIQYELKNDIPLESYKNMRLLK